jgi:uroporphyrinogen-III synthase
VTAATARELGIGIAVEAEPYSVPGLVDALARYLAAPGGEGPR